MEFYWNMSLQLLQVTLCPAVPEALSGLKPDHWSLSHQTMCPCYIRCYCNETARQSYGVQVKALGEVCVIAGE